MPEVRHGAHDTAATESQGPNAEAGGSTAAKDHFLRLMLFQPKDMTVARPHHDTPGETGRRFIPLPQTKLKSGAGFHLPDSTMGTQVRAESLAIEVMTDLRRTAAVTIGRFALIEEANRTMIGHGVRSLFVVDNERVLGIVTASDILGEKPLQATHQRGVRHDEVMVRDVMTPADRIDAIDLAEVLYATVGDIVETLKQSGRQHALVVDQAAGGRQMVRGIFSATQIARQLGITLQTPEIGHTFAEIEAAIGA